MRIPTRAQTILRNGRGLVEDNGPVYVQRAPVVIPATPMQKAVDAESKSGFRYIADWIARFLAREPAPSVKLKKLDIRAENGRLVFYRTYTVHDPSDNAGFWFTTRTRGEGDRPRMTSYTYNCTQHGGDGTLLRYETRLIRDWQGRVTRYDTYGPGPDGELKRHESLSVSQVKQGMTSKKTPRGTGPIRPHSLKKT
jgi:hypothetical protein